MRAVSLIASCVLLLVLAAVCVDASVFAGKSKAPASASKKHLARERRGAMVNPAELHKHGRHNAPNNAGDSNEWGPTYRMAYDLAVALQTRNFTAASALIADDAMIVVSGLGCGTLTKQQFIGAATNNPVLTTYFQFGTWTGYEGAAFGAKATIGAIGGPNSGFDNVTKIEDAFLFFVPNEAGTQLSIIEQFTDRSWAQPNNATQMHHVWEQLMDAANLHDINAFGNALGAEAGFDVQYAWNQFEPVQLLNKSAILAELTQQWATQSKFGFKTNSVKLICDIVLADVTFSTLTTANDGGASIMNFVASVVVDGTFKVQQISEFMLMPFLF